MCEWIRRVGLIALVGFVMPLALADVAQAQYREFSGKVDKINKKQLIVDNRMGDKVQFDRVKGTAVSDTRTDVDDDARAKWKDLKKGDWVTVKWKMADKPRKAYEVIVLPRRREAGEEL